VSALATPRGGSVIGIAAGFVALVVAAFAREEPDVVERYYSTGVYPWIAKVFTSAFALVPFSCMQAVLLGLLATVVVAFRRRGLLGAIGTIGAIGAAMTFLGGLNLSRPSIEARFGLSGSLDPATLERVLSALVERTNTVRAALTKEGVDLDAINDLPASQDNAVAALEAAVFARTGLPAVTSGRLKHLFPGDFLRWFGYSGFFWTGEHHINYPMAPGQQAVTIAHERAHLSGFAREADANFWAFLATLSSPSPAVQYSGLLSFWRNLRDERLPLQDIVRADMDAQGAFWRAGTNRPARRAAVAAQDAYLKVLNQPEGYRSYARGAKLVLVYLARHGFPPPVDASNP
jgi:hypothetical protein